ncbi:hypothetical protein C8Q75DRAFT_758547 [Abortiporus biennis]|nr:hypothetical protein C8Q75DRAFT_758547 [Abortiporus biennis]
MGQRKESYHKKKKRSPAQVQQIKGLRRRILETESLKEVDYEALAAHQRKFNAALERQIDEVNQQLEVVLEHRSQLEEELAESRRRIEILIGDGENLREKLRALHCNSK